MPAWRFAVLFALALVAAACSEGAGPSSVPTRDMADATVNRDGSTCAGCDAGPDVAHVVCPSTPPAVGAACPAIGEACEYGKDWWLDCDLVVQCTASGWQQLPAGLGCPAADAGGVCPATYAQASEVDAGRLSCPAAECQYAEGTCICIPLCTCGPQRRPEISGRWTCMPATSECPSPRPRLGTACTGAAVCSYGESCGCGEQLQCVSGVWQGRSL